MFIITRVNHKIALILGTIFFGIGIFFIVYGIIGINKKEFRYLGKYEMYNAGQIKSNEFKFIDYNGKYITIEYYNNVHNVPELIERDIFLDVSENELHFSKALGKSEKQFKVHRMLSNSFAGGFFMFIGGIWLLVAISQKKYIEKQSKVKFF